MLCCVEHCCQEPRHARTFTIATEGWETEVTAGFCCEHLDAWQSEQKPYLDLIVSGRFREEG
jgi:hypothetical protein